MRRLAVAADLFALLSAVALWNAPAEGGAEPSVSSPRVALAGPRERVAPPGAAVAEDEAALKALLAMDDGPREVWLRARTYRGDFVVGRPLALRGEDGATLSGTGTGTVLTIAAPGVEVENLRVRGSGRRHTQEDAAIKATAPDTTIRRVLVEDALFGVVLSTCTRCVLSQSLFRGSGDRALSGDAIKLWEADDAVVRECVVENTRDLVVWYSRRVRLEGNQVFDSRYGTHFMHAHDAVVRDSHLAHNIVGVFVMYSSGVRIEHNRLLGSRGPAGVGIGFKESDSVSIDGNWIVANTVGAYLDRTPRSAKTPVRFSRNVLALNDVGLRYHGSEQGVTFAHNDFTRNRTAVEVEGGGDALGTRFEHNYWSDYAGYDLDRDGTGDVAHEVKRLSSALLESRPALRLFDGTLSLALIDAMARVFPVFSAERLLVDERPRMQPMTAGPPRIPGGAVALRPARASTAAESMGGHP